MDKLINWFDAKDPVEIVKSWYLDNIEMIFNLDTNIDFTASISKSRLFKMILLLIVNESLPSDIDDQSNSTLCHKKWFAYLNQKFINDIQLFDTDSIQVRDWHINSGYCLYALAKEGLCVDLTGSLFKGHLSERGSIQYISNILGILVFHTDTNDLYIGKLERFKVEAYDDYTGCTYDEASVDYSFVWRVKESFSLELSIYFAEILSELKPEQLDEFIAFCNAINAPSQYVYYQLLSNSNHKNEAMFVDILVSCFNFDRHEVTQRFKMASLLRLEPLIASSGINEDISAHPLPNMD